MLQLTCTFLLTASSTVPSLLFFLSHCHNWKCSHLYNFAVCLTYRLVFTSMIIVSLDLDTSFTCKYILNLLKILNLSLTVFVIFKSTILVFIFSSSKIFLLHTVKAAFFLSLILFGSVSLVMC